MLLEHFLVMAGEYFLVMVGDYFLVMAGEYFLVMVGEYFLDCSMAGEYFRYLAHEKHLPARTLQQGYTWGPVVGPGVGADSMSEVPLYYL